MSEETKEQSAIVPADSMAAIQKHDAAEFAEIQKDSITFLPRIQVGGANSTAVKEGKLAMAHWGKITGDACEDLGDVIDVLVCAWQPKAMDTSVDPVLTSLDKKSELFQQIQAKSNVSDSGCMWGTDWLCYLPESEEFVTFFLASKSARREGPNMYALLGKAATLKIKFVKKKRYSWHVPVVVPCSALYEPPTAEDIASAAGKFSMVQTEGVEVVDDAEGGGGGEKRER